MENPFVQFIVSEARELLTHPDFPFFAATFVVLMVVASVVVYAAKRFERPQENIVVGSVDAMAERLTAAEHIGHFGSFLWDFENPYESYWSEAMYALLDMDYAKMPPKPEEFIKMAESADFDRAQKAWERARLTNGAFSFNFRAVSRKGRHMYLQVVGKTIKGKQGMEPVRIEGVAHDVTKEMEVDRAKSEFVSLASHQLKTPLTSVRWLSEALLRGSTGDLTSDQKKYVTSMHQASQRMMDMVNDLLNVSRIESDTLPIKPEDLVVKDLANEMFDEQRHTAEEKKVVLTLKVADGLPILHADKQLVRIIFQNLLSNAIKYTPSGGEVSCDISLAEAVRETVFVAIKDSGIGIPKEEQPRVFEKLHRASNAQASIPDGTGLGLYLVKTILDKAGGAISFESIEGKGTTFFVSIPTQWKASGDGAKS